MNSASLCIQAGRYENPIPPRFLAPIDSLKSPALFLPCVGGWGGGVGGGSCVSVFAVEIRED
jgi:hypothetical protein